MNIRLTDQQLIKADLIAAQYHLEISRHHSQLAHDALVRAVERHRKVKEKELDETR